MARPLRKVGRDGSLYTRRSNIESEIGELEKLSDEEIGTKCLIWPSSQEGFISSEVLLYFIRNTKNHMLCEKLLEALLRRIHRTFPYNSSFNDNTSLMNIEILEIVCDGFIDLILTDRKFYNERLDYFEINFNAAIAKDRSDARSKAQRKHNLTQGLYDEEENILPEVEKAIQSHNSLDDHEIDKEYYRRRLSEAIHTLPPLQQRIVSMWCQDIPITSKDPNEMTICKALNKSDKTIRVHRDSAFSKLRKELEDEEELL
ncbi:sigma-70 family RNA polymerase sigma factor [Acinetobacter johnsonii]|uniref:sigma-70 family RNA polymerase sigma factor n=1 Tax=Acinetobacter johnsonii TaxID=40214 RepID=UPI001322E1A5|nr:sigma-70 family RNA polymerase sigma factor [Acinetobacter johnsonii]MWC18556.1 sigma-70 family RNA polymerase sigma factor [Acinetobacter johnsonii]